MSLGKEYMDDYAFEMDNGLPLPLDIAVESRPTPGKGVGAPPAEAHHPYGPSRWPALLVCPHYTGKPGGADAQRGTALHARLAAILKGEAVPQPADSFEENTDTLAAAIKEDAKGAVLYVEQSVVLPAPPGNRSRAGRRPFFGRLDVAWFATDADALHVIDFKMVENPDRDYISQLVAYAEGILAKFGRNPASIYLHVAYCDTCHDSVLLLSREELRRSYADAYARVAEVERGDAIAEKPRQSGWCSLCEKSASCPAVLAVAESVSEGGVLSRVPARWPDLSNKEKARFLVVAEQASKWIKAVRQLASDDAKAGCDISDPDNGIFYVLSRRSGKLTLGTDETWELFKSRRLAREDFLGCLDVSTTKASKILCEKLGMKAAEATAALEACGTRAPDSLALVRKGA